MLLPQEKRYTPEEFYAMDLPERCELIYGRIYVGESENYYSGGKAVDMAPAPNFEHQKISGRIYSIIQNYIDRRKGKCQVFTAPSDVKLGNNTVQPDVYVTCRPDKIDGQNHNGAPDWVIEVLSPSTSKRDSVDKLSLYRESGVREYWMIDPMERRIIVYPFEENKTIEIYTFDSPITVHIYKDEAEPLAIRIADYFE